MFINPVTKNELLNLIKNYLWVKHQVLIVSIKSNKMFSRLYCQTTDLYL